jgi:diguanylate cyclase (GGDEF)-like protein/PAS domain S-box-containing protein
MSNPVAAPTIRVLLTEDVAADAELEVRELRRAGLRFTHRIVESEQSFERALRAFGPDVILSDFSMPGFDGMRALELARELAPETPFVFVSGTIGEEYAVRALKNGATDYVLKTGLVRLPAAVERALAEARERREKRRTEVELEIARERLTSIFNALPDMLWSADARTRRFLYVSPAAERLFGYGPEEFLARPDLWTELIYPRDRPIALQGWDLLEAQGGFDVDYRAVRRDGSVRWINDRGRLIRGDDGSAERVDGLMRDITEQVEHRSRIARLSRVREFSSSINSALVRLRERQALFEEICRIALDVGRFTGAHVGLLQDDGGEVAWVSRHGSSRGVLEGVVVTRQEDPDTGMGIVGRALRSGKAAVWNDVAWDPGVRLRERFAENGVAASGTFPLLLEGRSIGVFGLHASEPGFFDADEIRMLEELTANISFALELIAKQDQLTYLALYDPLTGLPNRTLFHERLTQATEAARRADAGLALALIDLERFKAINDTLGRQAGDRVLQALAGRLQEATGDINRVARLGSNVFALLFHGISGAEEVARRLEDAAARYLGTPFRTDDRDVRLAAKAGIAVYPEDGANADALFRNAEAALKRAKETGERYLFYAPNINARVSEQVELEHRLRRAVEQGELFLHFQPKLDLVTRRIVGLEALMRWHGADGELVPPARFVPVLEQTGLILEAGRQVIAAANAVHRGWQAKGLAPPRIAVNISALQLRRRSFVADVLAAMRDAGTDAGGVDIEITESLLMIEVADSIRKLRELREAGMHIALDDFGTGYSSLAYLSRLPVDAVKIDRGFVRGMTENAGDRSIVSAIVSLAHSLHLKVVAEGVETQAQAQLLGLLRCDQAQGYLFSPPLPEDRVEALIARAAV